MSPVVDLVYLDAGGGHRAAATALVQAAEREGRPWRLRPLNLTRVLDPEGHFRRVTGFEPEDYYNARLRRGWTLGLAQELKLLQATIRVAQRPIRRALEAHWRQPGVPRPDLVVSLIPNFNRPLHAACQRALPGVPYATLLTDLADLPESPSRFWIEAGLDQTVLCGTPRAVAQARAAGLPAASVRELSGMVLRPAFHDRPSLPVLQAERLAQRAALGLPDDRPAGLVMFGGHGSLQMLRIARALPEVPLVLVCGHNAALAAELRALRRPAPHAVIGFTSDVPGLMRAADFFIGKPGPGSLSEALQCGLPVITFENAGTMPQERYNVAWLREQGYGDAVVSVRALPGAVARLLHGLPAARERVAGYRNRAVFEALAVFAELLAAKKAAAGSGVSAAGTGTGVAAPAGVAVPG